MELTERAAAERLGVDGRIGSVIERLIAQGCGRRTPTRHLFILTCVIELSLAKLINYIPMSRRYFQRSVSELDLVELTILIRTRRSQIDYSEEEDEPVRPGRTSLSRSVYCRNLVILDEGEHFQTSMSMQHERPPHSYTASCLC